MKFITGSLNEVCKRIGFSFDQKIIEKDNLLYVDGINVGKIENNKYFWNINLFRLVEQFDNVLKLDSKKAFLFVCGRDILSKDGIENKYYFVFDSNDNFLGLAVFTGKMYKNKLNIGVFVDNYFGKSLLT